MAKMPSIDTFPDDPDAANLWLEQHIRVGTFSPAELADHLPVIHWASGPAIPLAPLLTLLQSRKEPMRAVYEHLRPRLSPEDMAHLARKLAEIWDAQDAPRSHRWMFDSLGEWGDDAGMLALGALIRQWQRQRKHARATSAITLLGNNGSDAALVELDDLAMSAKSASVRKRAAETLADIAHQRNISIDELADRTVPTLGFGPDGSRALDYGGRSFTARLRSDLSLEIVDAAGKSLRSIPRPGKGDEPSRAAATADWLKTVKKRLKELGQRQGARLERAMIAGRDWSADDWRKLFLDHPLMRQLAQRVVWTALQGLPENETSFRIAEDFTLADATEFEFHLDSADRIRLAHPLLWSDESRRRWREIFADYAIAPAFPQVERETYTVPHEQARGTNLIKYMGLALDKRFLRSQFQRLGWAGNNPSMYSGAIVWHVKSFDAQRISLWIDHDPIQLPLEFNTEERATIHRVYFTHQRANDHLDFKVDEEDALPLGQVDPLVVSEGIRDLERLCRSAQNSSE